MTTIFITGYSRTGILDRFDLHLQMPGLSFSIPSGANHMKYQSMSSRKTWQRPFHEFGKMGEIIGVATVSDLNKIIKRGKFKDSG